jgi:hypothetical protein
MMHIAANHSALIDVGGGFERRLMGSCGLIGQGRFVDVFWNRPNREDRWSMLLLLPACPPLLLFFFCFYLGEESIYLFDTLLCLLLDCPSLLLLF